MVTRVLRTSVRITVWAGHVLCVLSFDVFICRESRPLRGVKYCCRDTALFTKLADMTLFRAASSSGVERARAVLVLSLS